MSIQLADLENIIMPLIEKFSGKVSIDFRNIETGSRFAFHADEIFPTASTIKVFILGALLEEVQNGKFSLSDLITMQPEQQVGGSGVLKEFSAGSQYPIRDVAMCMIILSDNTATNMIIDLLGGVEKVNAHIKKSGLSNTELRNRIDFDAIGNDVHNLAVTTAKEFTDYLSLIAKWDILSVELSNVMFDMMSRQQYLDQFPRYLPYNPYAKELSVKQDIQVANKTGFYMGVRCDVGYLFMTEGKFAFSVLTKDCTDSSFNSDNEGSVFVGKVGKSIYDFIVQTL